MQKPTSSSTSGDTAPLEFPYMPEVKFWVAIYYSLSKGSNLGDFNSVNGIMGMKPQCLKTPAHF